MRQGVKEWINVLPCKQITQNSSSAPSGFNALRAERRSVRPSASLFPSVTRIYFRSIELVVGSTAAEIVVSEGSSSGRGVLRNAFKHGKKNIFRGRERKTSKKATKRRTGGKERRMKSKELTFVTEIALNYHKSKILGWCRLMPPLSVGRRGESASS